MWSRSSKADSNGGASLSPYAGPVCLGICTMVSGLHGKYLTVQQALLVLGQPLYRAGRVF